MSNIILAKSQLQEYAQKASLPAPVYETTKDGPSHEPVFKASVTVNGVKYESSDGFRNRKSAEQAAAHVALQDLVKKTNETGSNLPAVYESGLCKNLLQEYSQKLSLPVPLYTSTLTGEGQDAKFSCTVEIAGICYVGGPAKNKKEAEIKAARTALSAIQEQYSLQCATKNSHPSVGATRGNAHAPCEVRTEKKAEDSTGETSKKRKKQSKGKFARRRKVDRDRHQPLSACTAPPAGSADLVDTGFHSQQLLNNTNSNSLEERPKENEAWLLDGQLVSVQICSSKSQTDDTYKETQSEGLQLTGKDRKIIADNDEEKTSNGDVENSETQHQDRKLENEETKTEESSENIDRPSENNKNDAEHEEPDAITNIKQHSNNESLEPRLTEDTSSEHDRVSCEEMNEGRQ
eukprot:TRINITY_DN3334_c0_g1_i1.p1 TRINITY_DN3334_c0_g1~~TRINITY_DN3334_c0_g1_i1.p1  ORF type:complete len:405 (+),score=100.72 TRINITY_DN3334_c0_g1_i1:226-1440(+)